MLRLSRPMVFPREKVASGPSANCISCATIAASPRSQMRKKWRLRYLDVMAGSGRCKIKETGEEFPGSPFVALDYDFNDFFFVEEDPDLANALQQRVAKHPKSRLVKLVQGDWTEIANSGKLRFDDKILVVAFVDPTGISQVPMDATLQLTKNRRIDSLVTIQHSLGITLKSPSHQLIPSATRWICEQR
jgi:three-Cys-motif partner protein